MIVSIIIVFGGNYKVGSCEIFVKCNQTQRYASANYLALNLYREKSLKKWVEK